MITANDNGIRAAIRSYLKANPQIARQYYRAHLKRLNSKLLEMMK